MKLKTVLLVWIFSVFGYLSYSQNISEILVKADSLMATKNFNSAEKLYDRALFFADSNLMPITIQKTALCKIALNNYNEAANLYKLANQLAFTDSIYFSNLLKQALCLVLDKQILEAQKPLNEIKLLEAPTYYLGKSFLLQSIIETQNLNFALAQQNLDSAKNLLNETDQIYFSILINSNKNKININANHAAVYSAMWPGLGQTINGNYKDGINSFLLNGLFITAFIYTGLQYNFLSSFAFYSFFIPRFYIGGINGGKEVANKKIERLKKEYLTNYLKIYLKY